MRELTNELPKPMLRVQGKPILEHIVAGIVAAGVRDIFIVTGWRAEVVENHFGDGKKWNARIAFGRQVVQDGTGKAPELAKDFIGDSPFLLTYGDILVPPETYPQMLRRFGEGDFAKISSKNISRFLFVSGEPLNEPVAWRGPIVMNTQKELDKAFEELDAGTFIKTKNSLDPKQGIEVL